MADSRNIPDGQEWLIYVMQSLNYTADPEGVCFGVTVAGMQAALIGEIGNFYHRLSIIYELLCSLQDPAKFPVALNLWVNKRITTLNQAKQQAVENYYLLPPNEKIKFDKQEFIQNKLKALKESVSQSGEEISKQKAIYKKIKRTILENSYAQPYLEEALKYNLNSDMQLLLEIFPFFDIIQLCQKPWLYSHLYEPNARPKPGEIHLSSQLTLSQQLEMQGGMIKGGEFTGAYDPYEMTQYFLSLEDAIQSSSCNQPFCLLICNSCHAISVFYNPNPNPNENKWTIIDANHLELSNPLQSFSSPELIAQYVMQFLSKNQVACIATKIFTTASYEAQIKQLYKIWEQSNTWRELHEITNARAALADSSGTTWLLLAIEGREIDKIIELLDKGADVDAADSKGNTLLSLAARRGYIDIVELLLAKGADVNAANKCPTSLGHTALHLVAETGNVEMFNILLTHGADVNAVNTYGSPPLISALECGCVEIVKLLSAHPATDMNLDNPLACTIKNGNLEMVNILLSNPFTDVNAVDDEDYTPLDIALHMRAREIMQALIDRGAKVTAEFAQAAQAMGYTDIQPTVLPQKRKGETLERKSKRPKTLPAQDLTSHSGMGIFSPVTEVHPNNSNPISSPVKKRKPE